MRVVITGARGFVGPYLYSALKQMLHGGAKIIVTSKGGGEHPALGPVLPLDVTDEAAVNVFIAECRPTHVVHLAGVAAVTAASSDPDSAWKVHLHGTLNLARAILRECPSVYLLNVGTGLVYGDSAKSGRPLDEATLLAPNDDYSASKAAADLALGALVKRGLHCIRMRPFNHTGPGQTENFVIPNFAMQIARIKAGLKPPVISVGNLDAERDFLDVADVTDAYALAVAKSKELAPGTILNIASGKPRRIRDALDHLVALSGIPITVELDPARLRPSDTPCFIGNADLARRLLGWAPKRRFDDTLAAVLEYSRPQISGTTG